MRARSLIAAVAAGAALLAACGSDSDSSSSTAAAPSVAAPAATTAAGGSETTAATGGSAGAETVQVADTPLGAILTDADGRTVYAFMKDTAGTPTCADTCAEAWPPVLVDSEELPTDLDAAVFSVVERPDDTYQLKAGDWPLYLFSGDAAAGDTNGQGVSQVWWVVGADGQPVMS